VEGTGRVGGEERGRDGRERGKRGWSDAGTVLYIDPP